MGEGGGAPNKIMSKIKGEKERPIYFGAKPELLRLAAELRHSMTPAEKLLWEQLRNRQMMGCRFRRQHPFNIVILDFFCYELLLSIEIDGNVHADPSQKEHDVERTRLLNQFGVTEIRFSNNEVENRMNLVLEKIQYEITRLKK